MFDVGWSEMLIIGVVALLVVGPKELPGLLRTVGRFIASIKRQASEFKSQFDDALRDAEMEDLKKQVSDIKTEAENTIRDASSAFEGDFESPKSSPSIPGNAAGDAGANATVGPAELVDAGIDASMNAGSPGVGESVADAALRSQVAAVAPVPPAAGAAAVAAAAAAAASPVRTSDKSGA